MKESLKKLKSLICNSTNDRKRQISSMILATSLMATASGCSSDKVNIDNTSTIPNIVSNIGDLTTVDEYLNFIGYQNLEKEYLSYRKDGGLDKDKLNKSMDTLSEYGLHILKGSVLDALNILPENVDSIKILEKDNTIKCNVEFREYTEVLKPGNILVNEVTQKKGTYTLCDDASRKMFEHIKSLQNKKANVDEAYLYFEEFMLNTGTYFKKASYKDSDNKNVYVENAIKFTQDRKKVKSLKRK